MSDLNQSASESCIGLLHNGKDHNIQHKLNERCHVWVPVFKVTQSNIKSNVFGLLICHKRRKIRFHFSNTYFHLVINVFINGTFLNILFAS